MSSCYGYADDYKIMGTDRTTLHIDIRKVWKWCETNEMRLNMTKSKTLVIKGECNLREVRRRPHCLHRRHDSRGSGQKNAASSQCDRDMGQGERSGDCSRQNGGGGD